MDLYQIEDAINFLIESNIDENGNFSEDLEKFLDNLRSDFQNQSSEIVKKIKNLESDAEMLRIERNKLQDKEIRLRKQSDRLRKWLLKTMDVLDINTVKSGLFSISKRKGRASIKISNEEYIPDEFFSNVKVLDKTKLKNYILENDLSIEGVGMEYNDFVVIS